MITPNKNKNQHPGIISDQKGSAMVIALLFLIMMTLVATNLSQNTNVELQIVRNDTEKRLQFYHAESAAKEGAQSLENLDPYDLSDISVIDWINLDELDMNSIDLNDVDKTWTQSTADWYGNNNKGIGFTVVERTGVIDLSAPSNNHEYGIFGAYNVAQGMKKGHVMIEIGYKRRF